MIAQHQCSSKRLGPVRRRASVPQIRVPADPGICAGKNGFRVRALPFRSLL